MKIRRNILFWGLILGTFIILGACDNSSEKSNAKSSIPVEENDTTQNTDDSLSSNDEEESNENTSVDPSDNEENDQEDSSTENSTSSDDEDEDLSNRNTNTDSQRDAYFKKLNEMEEADRNTEVKNTTSEMEQLEEERYEAWDQVLNEIYAVLNEQLSPEDMEQLREEQRDWIKHRDEAAKESSLKYEGGSTEKLEYVATQATLTKERCYLLVAKYMK